jgi:2-oxoglutarate dehydrogenase E1 component
MATLTDSTVLTAFRTWGYLEADLDPLGRLSPQRHPELRVDGPEAEQARRVYCGPIGVEVAHIDRPEVRDWVAEQMEREWPQPDRARVLELLLRAELFEQLMHSRYLGSKRFSIEGVAALVPLLDEMLQALAEEEAEQMVLAMSHRGRLTVMATTVGRDPAEIFAGFEDVDPRSVLGSGDVKYHLGATGVSERPDGRSVRIHLASNPSHLEAVDPVVMGRVRAKQQRLAGSGENNQGGERKVVPVMVHGDSAFAGQGMLAEVLNLADLPGYRVGGTIHVVANNLIGFTTEPREYSSTRYATDVAKRLPVPIFHVNAEHPDAVVRVARMAAEFRHRFGTDVVVDLIGYRRFGHSEVDDPTITQPRLYAAIEKLPPLWKSYGAASGLDPERVDALTRQVQDDLAAAHQRAESIARKPRMATLPAYWTDFRGGFWEPKMEVDTGVAEERLTELADAVTSVPDGFRVHPKLVKLLDQRREMGHGKRPVDFGMAEALAFGSLLAAGVPVRLTGQDTRRGTFNQRHAVLIDVEDEHEELPLARLATGDAFFEIFDSPLSEASVLGYEYGYSRDYPEALVLWEAQFGDFVNGAQVPIDQFLAAGEDKWGLLSGLVLLLPHGYEGQGPEHSSARLERFLQLAAEDNLQVCQPSTAAQYFHLLRRQALRRWRKPLVVMTPKSMLRAKDASSAVADLARPRFLPVIDDLEAPEAQRLLFCTGKIGHELRAERARRGDTATGIVFLDQLYPFPREEVSALLDHHSAVRELLWVQEEPANQGALSYVVPRLERISGGRRVRTVKRSESASPATGSAKAHALEQKTLLQLAFERLGG